MSDRQRSAQTALQYALTTLLVVAGLKGLWLLGLTLFSEMHPAHHGWDGAIYTAVGRGMLNGLQPYADLFETKPPGMFFLSAASLWLFDDIRLANILQGFAELGTFCCLLLPLRYLPKNLSNRDRWLAIGTTFTFGVLLLTYSIDRSGHFQSESFGTFFIMLYGSNLLTTRNPWSAPRIFFSAACLAAAVGIKEPFFLIGLAMSILIVPRWNDLLPTYVLPLAIGLAIGTLLMLVIGYLEPYISIYLPEMLNGRAAYFRVPVWYYIFLVNYPLGDIARFSQPLALALPTLWCVHVAYNADAFGDSRKMWHLALLITAFAAFIAGMGFVVRSYEGQPNVETGLLTAGIAGACVFAGISIPLLRRAHTNEDVRGILNGASRSILALLLALYVMGSGGFLSQHFGFPVALYAILFILFSLHAMEDWESTRMRYIFAFVSTLSCIGILLIPTSSILPTLSTRVKVDAAKRSAARQIDALMDACGYERYLIVDSVNVPYEFTHHSPFGPGFHRIEFTMPVSWRKPPIPYLLDEFQANTQRATFAIAPTQWSKDMPQSMIRFLREHFTKTPPPCAGNIDLPQDVIFLFRKA